MSALEILQAEQSVSLLNQAFRYAELVFMQDYPELNSEQILLLMPQIRQFQRRYSECVPQLDRLAELARITRDNCTDPTYTGAQMKNLIIDLRLRTVQDLPSATVRRLIGDGAIEL